MNITNNISSITELAEKHYENFPVISFLVPKNLRKDIAVIYWFARTADDIADEGDYSTQQRFERLDAFETDFHEMQKGRYHSGNFEILHSTIISGNLTPSLFTDLLSAFKQDVVKKRYNNYEEIIDYCRWSANPVGRLLLELFNVRREDAFEYSDKICTALQLTNFYQDVLPDYLKGRIYFAEDEMKYFGVTEKSFEIREINDNLIQLVKFNLERTEGLFLEGKKLLPFLKGRIRLEIKWTIEGGLAILHKIKKNNYNIFIRPRLTKAGFAGILIKSLLNE